MCRYAWHVYKTHYACFRCRKVYRQRPDSDLPPEQAAARRYTCPQCGEPMHNMGLDFKAPAQSDIARWSVVETLFRQGIAYHSCGCGGEGRRPTQMRDVAEFLDRKQKPTQAQRILGQKVRRS